MLIQTQIPDPLWQRAQLLVKDGWAKDVDALLTESLRRFVDSHDTALTEQFLREDVAWGLHGG